MLSSNELAETKLAGTWYHTQMLLRVGKKRSRMRDRAFFLTSLGLELMLLPLWQSVWDKKKTHTFSGKHTVPVSVHAFLITRA